MKPQPRQPATNPRFVRTIEKTGKGYKAWMAAGVLMILLGFVMIAATMANGGSPIGVPVALVGLLIYVSARIGAWWNHG